jgi:hypothetical protein
MNIDGVDIFLTLPALIALPKQTTLFFIPKKKIVIIK